MTLHSEGACFALVCRYATYVITQVGHRFFKIEGN